MTHDQANAIHQAGVHPETSPGARSKGFQQFGRKHGREEVKTPIRGIDKTFRQTAPSTVFPIRKK